MTTKNGFVTSDDYLEQKHSLVGQCDFNKGEQPSSSLPVPGTVPGTWYQVQLPVLYEYCTSTGSRRTGHYPNTATGRGQTETRREAKVIVATLLKCT